MAVSDPPAPPARSLDPKVQVVLAAAAVGLWVGWDAFWFLCDDAYIAFRYVAHGKAGLGYVWNPPPFRPVEGYTSLLWVALLEGVWRLFGVAPPRSANVLSLACAYGTLGLTAAAVLRLRLPEALARRRAVVLALVLGGTLTNRTFLAWTSSGLETSLFGMLLSGWLFSGLLADARRPSWPSWVAGTAALLALTRPDGLLFVCVTPFLIAARGRLGIDRRALLGLAPLAVVPVHLVWRHARYGAWLPNTYFAKSTGPWPEAGARYLASFVLEYGLFVWLGVLVAAAAQKTATTTGPATRRAFALGLGAVVAHVVYYTLVVGGDHFEYRVYAHLVPLVFLSAAWSVGRLDLSPPRALAVLGAVVAASWPIPWTHWSLTHELRDRASTLRLSTPVAPHLPGPLAIWGRGFDRQQAWLIERFIGMRHQEHKVLAETLARTAGDAPPPGRGDGIAVLGADIVGVVGWTYPDVAVIDQLGLSDGVIARTPVDPSRVRRMAHERKPPPGYLECFAPNVVLSGARIVKVLPRATALTDERIVACERDFGAQVGW